ncbi:MAG: anaerobic sulfatase maturase [Candidatus Sumerlaeota bacterium]|nr:anaerobic sulfatase maturase [Candidatus Sumerlaeota bacterium]
MNPKDLPGEEGAAVSRCPRAFHVIIKPTGSACNLDCRYCFYLPKKALYPPDTRFRMSGEVLESFTRQYIESQQVPVATFYWQGGEPTLMGADFFRSAVELQRKYRKRGLRVANALQTNGVLLGDEWCRFLRENRFLAGLSLDGPARYHDYYRVSHGGNPTFKQARRALKLLQYHGVAHNVLCVVNRMNAAAPLDVYRFFKREGVSHIQFIPAAGRMPDGGLTEWSVTPELWGDFLCGVFDDWVCHDMGEIDVQIFESALESWYVGEAQICSHAEICGACLALEHNGDLFSCDHFVDVDHYLGNIMKTPLTALVGSEFQREFGRVKQDGLGASCRQCGFLFACNGGCPKDRFASAAGGDPELNYLCAGYKKFYSHAEKTMIVLSDSLERRNQLESFPDTEY